MRDRADAVPHAVPRTATEELLITFLYSGDDLNIPAVSNISGVHLQG